MIYEKLSKLKLEPRNIIFFNSVDLVTFDSLQNDSAPISRDIIFALTTFVEVSNESKEPWFSLILAFFSCNRASYAIVHSMHQEFLKQDLKLKKRSPHFDHPYFEMCREKGFDIIEISSIIRKLCLVEVPPEIQAKNELALKDLMN